ncbi:hypothetical protein LINPERPRIM_LOCUS26835 [Linum perenne]
MGLSLTMVQVSVHEIISGEEPEQSPGIISSSPLRARDCPASYSGERLTDLKLFLSLVHFMTNWCLIKCLKETGTGYCGIYGKLLQFIVLLLEDTVEFFSSSKNIKSVSTMLITSSPKPWLTWKKSSRFFVVQFQDLVVDLVHSIVEIVTCSDRQDMQIFEYAFPLKL